MFGRQETRYSGSRYPNWIDPTTGHVDMVTDKVLVGSGQARHNHGNEAGHYSEGNRDEGDGTRGKSEMGNRERVPNKPGLRLPVFTAGVYFFLCSCSGLKWVGWKAAFGVLKCLCYSTSGSASLVSAITQTQLYCLWKRESITIVTTTR
jgi:hypothetical protein